jgi:hypothetical protein
VKKLPMLPVSWSCSFGRQIARSIGKNDTIAGYEVIHMICKGQACGNTLGDEARSAPSPYCWYVWNGSLIHSAITSSCIQFQSCNRSIKGAANLIAQWCFDSTTPVTGNCPDGARPAFDSADFRADNPLAFQSRSDLARCRFACGKQKRT